MIRAVLYDIGGVLYTVSTAPGQKRAFHEQLLARLSGMGIDIPDDPDAFSEKLHRRAEAYKRWTEISRLELPAYRIWKEFYLADYDVPARPLTLNAAALSDFYDGHARVTHTMRPHLPETVRTLSDMGMTQGIISNIISKGFAPQLLREYNIDAYMALVQLSSECGYRKPDRRIFDLALTRLGIPNSECAYVGDTISRDVIGGRNANLGLVIQIENPAAAHRDAAYRDSGYAPDALISDLSELPALIRAKNRSV